MSSSSTERKETRRFGLVAFLFFGALFLLGLWREKLVLVGLVGMLSLMGACILVVPAPLRPVHLGWQKTADFVGTGITTLSLVLIYYLVITPFGVAKRVLSGSMIPLAPDKTVPSYWIPRTEPAQPRERFHRRY